ncbi:hypothetical protein [Consotaella salsifontis]|uniref:Uncharacterized protein n=1 Tax=Consotaella salsifontis TaxID=1365950 RepID=A0A1T4RMQ6_9HYPH|nr:hypothetical protein [Consotaella salsifontis]SKA17223.1 hypothetical protein SAMN05428963_10798 [Consotaella salsifontis]
MKKSKSRNLQSRSRWLLGAVGGLAIASAAVFLAYPSMTATAAANPPIPSGETLSSWVENGRGGRYLLELIDGQAPSSATSGTVLSDADCEPDADRINHCHNEIKLADGRTITVINNHRMMNNRCLGPGDKLKIETLDSGWVVGKLV